MPIGIPSVGVYEGLPSGPDRPGLDIIPPLALAVLPFPDAQWVEPRTLETPQGDRGWVEDGGTPPVLDALCE